MDETPDQQTRRVLIEHGLPAGLLPAGIVHARIDDRGAFEVELPARVQATRAGYPIRYDRRVSGTLAPGKVLELRGVQVRQVAWFDVAAIEARGDHLVFSVGPVRRALPASAFAVAPGAPAEVR